MAGIQVKKMNWVRPQSAYDSLQTWRAKRQAAVAEFESVSMGTASAFNAIWSNQISGGGELAANAALMRISTEGKNKIDAATRSIDMTA